MGDAGILNVFAAGNISNNNNDINPHYPSNYTSPSIVAVAASDANDAKAGFSCFGPTSVDLAAPGVGILSTTWGSNSTYGTSSGTSMATPHVAGAAALLSAYNPNLSVASLKATLLNTVDPVAVRCATGPVTADVRACAVVVPLTGLRLSRIAPIERSPIASVT